MREKRKDRGGMLGSISRSAAALGGLIIIAMLLTSSTEAQTYKVLYTFTGGADGGWPWDEVIRDSSGNLYGMTTIGGDVNDCASFSGCGTVYKLDSSGNFNVLHTFTGGADGQVAAVFGSLVRDKAGFLYGVTTYGGTSKLCSAPGCGTVFRVSPSGKKTLLHSFPADSKDGQVPQGGLLVDAAGNLYGTTFGGGAYLYYGTIFKVTKAGKETILHSFNGYDGGGPVAGLVADAAGNMYGTTDGGGLGAGTVFKISKKGKLTALYSFKGPPDGAVPTTRVVLDKQGNIYGTTSEGGNANACPYLGCGVVFEITRAGKERVLHTFVGSDGGVPNELFLDANGILYGTTWAGGAHDSGTIYKLDTKGNFTDLYDFTDGTDGGLPFDGLIQDNDGNFYGTAYLGGLSGGCPYGGGCGTVFEFTP